MEHFGKHKFPRESAIPKWVKCKGLPNGRGQSNGRGLPSGRSLSTGFGSNRSIGNYYTRNNNNECNDVSHPKEKTASLPKTLRKDDKLYER